MDINADQFDQLALNFYQPTSDGEEARSIIMSICQDPTTLLLVHNFFQNSSSAEARFLALQIMIQNIQNGWTAIGEIERSQIKMAFLQCIMDLAKSIKLTDISSLQEDGSNLIDSSCELQEKLIHQVDAALVQVLLIEWPQLWPNFLQDFIAESRSILNSEAEQSQNNFYSFVNAIYLFQLLSSEIRTNPNLLSNRKSELISALYDNFQVIYSYIKIAMETNLPAIQISSLMALSEFFQWIDIKYMPSDDISSIIINQLATNPICRKSGLNCILSIVSRESVVVSRQITQLFNEFIGFISTQIQLLEDQDLIELFVEIFSRFICLDRCALMPNDPVVQWMIEYTKMITDPTLLSEIISMWHTLTKCYIFDSQSLPFSSQYLVPLQFVLCTRISKPVDFGGDPSLFDDFSETLSLLFKMHKDDIFRIMIEKLSQPEFKPQEMLCWIFSLGAVSGVCDASDEQQLLSAVMKILTNFEQNESNGPIEIDCINESILFIASQYTRYLQTDEAIIQLVLEKIIQGFQSESLEMHSVSVYAFKKIAIGCGKYLLSNGFVSQLFEQFDNIFQQLSESEHVIFFTGLTHIVKHCINPKQKQEMAVGLFNKANSIQILIEVLPIIDGTLLTSMLEPSISSMAERFVSSDIVPQEKELMYSLFLKFLSQFPNSQLVSQFIQLFINDLNAMLHQLQETSEVDDSIFINSNSLSCLATIIRSQKNQPSEDQNNNKTLVPFLFESVVAPAFEFLKDNFSDFPILREHFFMLIEAICENCGYLNDETISALLNITFYGLKHPSPVISEISMNSVSSILNQLDISSEPAFVSGFYSAFYVQIFNELLELLFDGLHRNLFSHVTQTIGYLLNVVASGKISHSSQQDLIEIVFTKLNSMFPTCNPEEVRLVANDIANSVGNNGKLRQVLHDFVIASRQLQTEPVIVEDELQEKTQLNLIQEAEEEH